jgi:hypothetical protein
MRHPTPEQIGLDYQALLELFLMGKERALELIGKKQILDRIGEDAVRQWLQRHHQEVLDLIGEATVRQWLQRRQQAAAQGPTAPPSAALPPEKPNGADQD